VPKKNSWPTQTGEARFISQVRVGPGLADILQHGRMTRRDSTIAWACLLWLLLPPACSAQPPGDVVFVGSSIIHRWTNLGNQMAPLPVVNRGVDGAVTADMLHTLDTVVPFRPKVIVYYCGSNDISIGEPAGAIADRIQLFFTRAKAALPDVRIIFLSVIRAPEKRDRWGAVDEVNRRIQTAAAGRKDIEYVDVNPVLVDGTGAPRLDLYMADQLHLRPPAYDALASLVKPIVAKAVERP
jgi:lysophospholipase L1-like esterase